MNSASGIISLNSNEYINYLTDPIENLIISQENLKKDDKNSISKDQDSFNDNKLENDSNNKKNIGIDK